MLDANPNLTLSQVRDLLQRTAVDWGPAGQDVDYGWGRLDSYAAVRAAGSYPTDTPPAGPGHATFTGTLTAAGATNRHTLNVTDTAYPINVTLIMTEWQNGAAPDFDIYVYNPDGSELARSAGTSRQEQVSQGVTQTGTYQVLVKSYAGAGSYVVDVSAGMGPLNEPPVVAIAQPAEGDTVTGTVSVKVTAADDVGVSKVELAVDDGACADITSSFDGTYYTYAWESSGAAAGAHTLTARATDGGGLQSLVTRNITVSNPPTPPPGAHELTRTGQVTQAIPNSLQTFTVMEAGYVDFRLDWESAADLDFYVYAPDGTFIDRAYTLNNPEQLRVDTVRWGTGAYTVKVNLFSGPNSPFTLTAEGYRRDRYTGNVSPASPNATQSRTIAYMGLGRVEVGWPGRSDLDLFVFDPGGAERSRAFTLNNPERAAVEFDRTGNWSVRVNLYAGTAATFTMDIFAPEAVLA